MDGTVRRYNNGDAVTKGSEIIWQSIRGQFLESRNGKHARPTGRRSSVSALQHWPHHSARYKFSILYSAY